MSLGNHGHQRYCRVELRIIWPTPGFFGMRQKLGTRHPLCNVYCIERCMWEMLMSLKLLVSLVVHQSCNPELVRPVLQTGLGIFTLSFLNNIFRLVFDNLVSTVLLLQSFSLKKYDQIMLTWYTSVTRLVKTGVCTVKQLRFWWVVLLYLTIICYTSCTGEYRVLICSFGRTYYFKFWKEIGLGSRWSMKLAEATNNVGSRSVYLNDNKLIMQTLVAKFMNDACHWEWRWGLAFALHFSWLIFILLQVAPWTRLKWEPTMVF